MVIMKKDKNKVTIRQICARPRFYVGRTVTVEGIFRGWEKGQYDFPAAAEDTAPDRTAWLIATGPECAYVVGGRPDVNALNPADIGCRIEVTGMVLMSDDGGIYLSFEKGQRLSLKPVKARPVKIAA